MEERRISEIRSYADLIWGVAELLRGDYKQADYGKVILPLVLMRRLDQTLEATREQVVAKADQLEAMDTAESGVELVLLRVTKLYFYNRSKVTFPGVLDDQSNVAQYLRGHIDGYSKLAREVIDKFDFERHIDRLDEADLLFQVIGRICRVDLHPDNVSNLEMGYLFEELIRRAGQGQRLRGLQARQGGLADRRHARRAGHPGQAAPGAAQRRGHAPARLRGGSGVYREFVQKPGVGTRDEVERRLPRCMESDSAGVAAALLRMQERGGGRWSVR